MWSTSSPGAPTLLYIDLHLVHEVTSPQAFQGLRERGLKVRRPDLTIATTDHSIPTTDRSLPIVDPIAAKQLAQLETNCAEFGIRCLGMHSDQQGIVHVIGPELGLTQPGMTVVCGDSHTATHGAFGALAFGIGTSEVEHVLATQCLLQRPSKTFQVRVDGALKPRRHGQGHHPGADRQNRHRRRHRLRVRIHAARAIRALAMEERMTVCNMSIEGGARAGLVAPDDTTFQYLCGRPYAPKGAAWDAAVGALEASCPPTKARLTTAAVTIDADALEPMITYGTNPGMGVSITARVPDPSAIADPLERDSIAKALRYMGLEGGKPLLGHPIDVVFIGSCTNSRISDLRSAGGAAEGPQGESEGARDGGAGLAGSEAAGRWPKGLPEIFRAAGCEWREPGCSMCIAMNGDQLQPGEYSVSTSNRNFEGRQGKGGRTFLASPLTAAASAITGVVTDVRTIAMKPFTNFESRLVPLPDQQHRYRPDHSRALPEDHFQGRPRQAAFLRLALRRAGQSEAGFHPEPAARDRARRCCWPATTSAAAARASTRPGR